LKVRSEVIDYGTSPILAGDKIHVTIPNENVDSDYRIISTEYRASGRDQTLEVELELAKEPQLLADFIYGFRKAIQKLDKYKASSSAGGVSSGGGGGGGGGGGMVQHANEWHDPDMATAEELATHEADPNIHHNEVHANEAHDPDMALQSDFASHKDRHKADGADAFTVADLLDAVARIKVRKNSGASNVGVRRRLNLIEGSSIALTIADDPTDEEIDAVIASICGTGAKGYLVTNQNIATGTWTKVALDGEIFDDLGEFNPSTYRFTIQNTGRYLLSAAILFYEMTDQASIELAIRRVWDSNYAEIINPVGRMSGSGWCGLNMSTVTQLQANWVLELWAYQSSGATKLLRGDNIEGRTFMSVIRLK